jgi:hypothetical protein
MSSKTDIHQFIILNRLHRHKKEFHPGNQTLLFPLIVYPVPLHDS